MINEEFAKIKNIGDDPSERRRAVRKIYEENDWGEDTIRLLANGLNDADLGVRDICFASLIEAKEEYIENCCETLARILPSSPIEIRATIAEIMVKYGKRSIAHLQKLLEDSDESVRKTTCDAISQIKDVDSWKILIPVLKDKDKNVVIAAIVALGDMKAEKALDEIFALWNSDADYKPFIVEAIGKIGSVKAQEFLSKTLQKEEDIFIQSSCIDAISICSNDESALLDLFDALATAPNELQGLILKAVVAIASRRGKSISLNGDLRKAALRALIDDEEDIRAAGLLALGNSYRKTDINGLARYCEKGVEDRESIKFMMINLLANSSEESAQTFFSSIFSKNFIKASALEIISSLPPIWSSAKEENAKTTFSILEKAIYNDYQESRKEISDILSKLNAKLFSDSLSDRLESASAEDIEIAKEIIVERGLAEFIPKLQEIKEKNSNIDTIAIDNAIKALSWQ